MLSVSYNNQVYIVPENKNKGWAKLSDFLVAIANFGQTIEGQRTKTRVATTTPVTVVATDHTIVTKLAAPAAVAVTLPTGVLGQVFEVVDGTGDAGTNYVTVAGTGGQLINGSANFLIRSAYGSATFQYTSDGWKVSRRQGSIKTADLDPSLSIPDSRLATIATAGKVSNSATTATSANTASAIVARDASGNFTAGIITASLVGNADTASFASTAGSATTATTAANATNALTAASATNVVGPVAIANGGTGQATKTPAFDALSPTTTKGDLIAYDGTDNVRRAVGTDGQVLTADSAQATGLNWSSPLTNPMTTLGDVIIGGASGAATRLAHPGAANRLFKSTSTTALGYAQIVDADVDAAAAIAGSKLQAANGTTNAGVVSTGTQDIGGLKTFLTGLKLSNAASGYTPSQFDFYEAGSISGNATGPFVSTAYTYYFARLGKGVILFFPGIGVAGNGVNTTIGLPSLPSRLYPVSTVNNACFIARMNGADQGSPGYVDIQTGGGVGVGRNPAAGSTGFGTGGGINGFYGFSVAYIVA